MIFSIALLIGLYSYLILVVGLLGLLYPPVILGLSAAFLIGVFGIRRKIFPKEKSGQEKKGAYSFFGYLILLQAGVNLIGVFGPEISFDALWYHLTIPKLYVEQHAVFYIPGSLLYYSAMPKLIDMLYVPALLAGGEVTAKAIHFAFGILTVIGLIFLGRKSAGRTYILAAAIFYSNLVVGWESITSYIDLGRTFFEFLAFAAFLQWIKTREKKWVIESGMLLGLAISAKLLAIGSLLIFFALFLFDMYKHHISFRKQAVSFLLFTTSSLILPLPWFVFSYVHTGSPIFPFFTKLYPIQPVSEFDVFGILSTLWTLFVQGADPISPVYAIFLPLIVITARKLQVPFQFMALYSVFALIVWYVTPRTGGSRFFLPYLPVLSLLVAETYRVANVSAVSKKIFMIIIIFLISTSVLYRAAANAKFIPYIFGKQSKDEFLTKHLNFSFGDFYDTDNYFARSMNPSDTVLLYGFHNLYYVNFPFIHESWVTAGNTFRYIATQNTQLPERFQHWRLIYENPTTGVKLYSNGDQTWIY